MLTTAASQCAETPVSPAVAGLVGAVLPRGQADYGDDVRPDTAQGVGVAVAGAAGQGGVDLVEHGPAGSHLLVRAHSHPTM